MWPVTWPTEANENTRAARGTLSAITVGSSNLCTGPKFRAAASHIVADQNFSVVLDLVEASQLPGYPVPCRWKGNPEGGSRLNILIVPFVWLLLVYIVKICNFWGRRREQRSLMPRVEIMCFSCQISSGHANNKCTKHTECQCLFMANLIRAYRVLCTSVPYTIIYQFY